MASGLPFSEDLSCPVCRGIFRDPVLLSCDHNVCKGCISQLWMFSGSQECPVCKEQTSVASPCNNALKSLCEVAIRRRRGSASSTFLCSVHGEQLDLFCLEDGQLLCMACYASKTHEGHECCTVDIAARTHKKELQTALRTLLDKRQIIEEVNLKYIHTSEHMKHQTHQTERQIKDEFEKLHRFLREEEAARIAALRQEKEQKRQMIQEKTEKTSKAISFLSDIQASIEEGIRAEDISFIQNFKEMVKGYTRAQCLLPDPQMVPGSLIDVAKHLGNLRFRVWERLHETVFYTPVILDPNTLSAQLALSDDLTSVQPCYKTQHLPNNPERFDQCHCVLGSQGFFSGIHSWDVEIRDAAEWEVGVTSGLIPRTGKTALDRKTWSVKCGQGEYVARSSTIAAFRLHLKESLQKIRVQLDCDSGLVAFSDPVSDSHLFTFNCSFTEKLFPFFVSPCTHSVLRILPVDIGFTVEAPLNMSFEPIRDAE